MRSLTPGQQVVKIVRDELTALMGSQNTPLDLKGQSPATFLLVGLQGSGKTTSAAKLAGKLQEMGRRPILGRRRRAPPGRDGAVAPAGRADPGSGGGAAGFPRRGRHLPPGFRRGGFAPGRRHRCRHRRAVADRRGPDAGTGGHQGCRQAALHVPRGRRHDRTGSRQRGNGVRQGSRHRGRHSDQTGRRRPRRRGAVDSGGRRQADPIRRCRGKARRPGSLSTRNAWPRGFSAWAMS